MQELCVLEMANLEFAGYTMATLIEEPSQQSPLLKRNG